MGNGVAVKIYGQEYSLSGDLPRDEMMRLADMVDQKMKEIGEYYKGSVSSIAVLAAMEFASNIASAEDKSKLVDEMNERINQAAAYNEVLRKRIEELTTQLENSKSVPEESQKLIHELEAKCRDIESSFFDIQMENIHLKNEIESLKRQQ